MRVLIDLDPDLWAWLSRWLQHRPRSLQLQFTPGRNAHVPPDLGAVREIPLQRSDQRPPELVLVESPADRVNQPRNRDEWALWG